MPHTRIFLTFAVAVSKAVIIDKALKLTRCRTLQPIRGRSCPANATLALLRYGCSSPAVCIDAHFLDLRSIVIVAIGAWQWPYVAVLSTSCGWQTILERQLQQGRQRRGRRR